MLKKSLLYIVIISSLIQLATAQLADRRVGMNLGSLRELSQEWMFVDAMKQCRPWLVQDIAEQNWSIEEIEIPQRSDGYPTHVPFWNGVDSLKVHTQMFRALPWSYPGGVYTLIFEGSGEIQLELDTETRSFTLADSAHSFIVDPTWEGLHLTINRSEIDDPIHNIRVIMPGFADNYETQIFYPKFLELLQPFEVIRFVNPQSLNEIRISRPEEITPVDYYTQAAIDDTTNDGNGLAYEYIAQLCNRLDADPWLGIPILANDSAVAVIAQKLRDGLDSDRKVYLEYHNEVWNPAYPFSLGGDYINEQGMAMGLADWDFMAGLRWYTLRSLEIFEIFTEQFGPEAHRLVKILTPQAGWLFTGEIMLDAYEDPLINPNNVEIDALSIAPYFATETADNIGNQGLIESITVSEILDSLENAMHREVPNMVIPYSSLASDYNLELLAYEGGQHLNAFQFEDDTLLYRKLDDANRDPRMYQIYCDYYDIWYENGGDLFNVFAFMDAGSFSNLYYLDQDTTTAPKWLALWDCVIDTVVVGIEEQNVIPERVELIGNYPNPFNASTRIQFDINQASQVSLSIFDLRGRQVSSLIEDKYYRPGSHFVEWHENGFASGIYYYRLEVNGVSFARKMLMVK